MSCWSVFVYEWPWWAEAMEDMNSTPTQAQLDAVRGKTSTFYGILEAYTAGRVMYEDRSLEDARARIAANKASATPDAATGSPTERGATPTLQTVMATHLGDIKQEAAAAGQDAAMLTTDTSTLKKIAFKGMVHQFNVSDPFGPVLKRITEIRKRRIRWAADEAYRNSLASKMGCALSSRFCLGVKWQPGETADPLHLPHGHQWDPTEADIKDLIATEVFAVRNIESGAAAVSGDSDPDEYNLRKCICYDLLEYDGAAADLAYLWEYGVPVPAPAVPTGSPTERGATGSGSASSMAPSTFVGAAGGGEKNTPNHNPTNVHSV